MEIYNLFAISPIDGRYAEKTKELSHYFSEFAYIKERIHVELKYIIELIKILDYNISLDEKKIMNIYENFSVKDAIYVKEIESKINHDVKAVEYFLKEQDSIPNGIKKFIHFGLTSQDISTTAIVRNVMHGSNFLLTYLLQIHTTLNQLSKTWKNIPMLSRTHGQPASPTYVNKEIKVFIERIDEQCSQLYEIPWSTKFGGAVGNFNALSFAYPDINWIKFANDFITLLGLTRSQYTTQIDHYDNLVARFDCIRRLNNILIDLNRDIWMYISHDYFKQKINNQEVGSSTMPHKVNPIDFENSEGNFMMANSIFNFLSNKLPISRMQRDLTDSTVVRNIGVAFAHTLIGYKSLLKGLNKLEINETKIRQDLQENSIIIVEGIQTILKKDGIENAYELFKQFSRNNDKKSLDDIGTFIKSLYDDGIIKSQETYIKLLELTPENYPNKIL